MRCGGRSSNAAAAPATVSGEHFVEEATEAQAALWEGRQSAPTRKPGNLPDNVVQPPPGCACGAEFSVATTVMLWLCVPPGTRRVTN